MYKIAFASVLLVWGHLINEGHTYHFGRCPTIASPPDFHIEKMLGLWYVIQKSNTSNTCISYKFTQTDKPNEYLFEENGQFLLLGLASHNRLSHYTERLSVLDNNFPAIMTVQSVINPGGFTSYTVFATDYDTYAGIFICQRMGLVKKSTAAILSREKTLDQVKIDKLTSKLTTFNINLSELTIIHQTDCLTTESRPKANTSDNAGLGRSLAGLI